MKLESQPAINSLLYIVTLLLCLVLMYLSGGGTNILPAFLLGCMLFRVGTLALTIGETRRVERDEHRKRILLDVKRRVGGNRQIIIPLAEITSLGIGAQGKYTSGSRFYVLVVTLKTLKQTILFFQKVKPYRRIATQYEWLAKNYNDDDIPLGMSRSSSASSRLISTGFVTCASNPCSRILICSSCMA